MNHRATALLAEAAKKRTANMDTRFDHPDYAERSAEAAALIMEGLRHVDVGDQIQLSDYDPPMIVASKPGDRVVLTTDGNPVDVTGWHNGTETEWVYYERWNVNEGREAHGWVDAESRRLLQTG